MYRGVQLTGKMMTSGRFSELGYILVKRDKFRIHGYQFDYFIRLITREKGKPGV